MDQCDVMLVYLPFAQANLPALSLSILKSCLTRAKISASVSYENINFAAQCGFDCYNKVDIANVRGFLGEWVFAEAAYGARRYPVDEYVARLKGFFADDVADWTQKYALPLRDNAADFIAAAVERTLARQPKIVALSDMFQQRNAVIAFLRELKARAPEIITLVGGANCFNEAGSALLEYVPQADYVFFGEADEIFAEVCGRLLSDGLIPTAELPYGVIGRDGLPLAVPPHRVTRDVAAVPYPDFSEFIAAAAQAKVQYANLMVEGSRGCWWGEKHPCTFCGLNGTTRTYRAKSVERLAAELDHYAALYPDTMGIIFSDSILSREHTDNIGAALGRARRRPGGYFAEIKANLTEDDIVRLVSAGFRQIQPGIESINDHVLQLMNKGCRAIKQLELLKLCRTYDLKLTWNLLAGFPGETEEDYEDIARLIPKITHFTCPNAFIHIMYQKNSVYADNPAAYGLTLRPSLYYAAVAGNSDDYIARTAYTLEPADAETRDYYYSIRRKSPAHNRVKEVFDSWRDRAMYLPDRLVMKDRADHIRIDDFRRAAKEYTYRLTGAAAAIYRAAYGTIRREELIAAVPYPSAEAEAALEYLAAENLIVEIGGECLTLAVDETRKRRMIPDVH